MKLEEFILNEGINDKGIFKAIFMTGMPGSGKSYVRQKLGGGVDPRVVNTDTWTEWFDDPDWDDKGAKIKLLTKSQLSLYLNSMLPLWIDGTSSNSNNLMTREGLLTGIGYDTGMLWVNTDIETSLRRAEERHDRGGRYVSKETIINSYNKLKRLKGFYQKRFPFFYEVDNNDGMLTDKVIVQAYKATGSFFSNPVENPIGVERIRQLKESGGKYLVDTHDYEDKKLKKMANTWFDK